MGVRVVVDDEEEECTSNYAGYSATSTAGCYACGAKAGSNNYSHVDNSSSNNNKTSGSTSSNNKCPNQSPTTCHGQAPAAEPHGTHTYSRARKDLVGNCKEFRIEHNKYDLRIIGNDNRVRIGENAGTLQIIGNSTRLKINSNSGHIKYTGNDGRICLGSESTQQLVDYIGCNGILKIINAMELCTLRQKSKTKCGDAERRSGVKMAAGNAKKQTTSGAAKAEEATKLRSSHIPKSASYGGHDGRDKEWTQFDSQFQRQSANWSNVSNVINMSLPNLKQCKCNCKCRERSAKSNNGNFRFNVINNIGNIVIQNAINVSI